MRQGQQNKRMRGRGGRKGPNPLTRSYESNGPDVKVRGTPLHIAEKYLQLARDAQAAGDRVHSENLLQHAEHYFRIVAAAQAQMPQHQQMVRQDNDGEETDQSAPYRGNGQERQHARQDGQPSFGISDPQPYVNGGAQGHDEEAEDEDQAEQAGASDEQPVEASPGGGRSRRRRPYRARTPDQGGDGAPASGGEAAAGDD